MTVNSDEMLKD